jgi:hypothetical protein
MKTIVVISVAVAITAWSMRIGADNGCAADGEPVQWVADYCMLKMATDDEIAVSECIEEETKRIFPDSCASNLHFKRSMCEVVVSNGTRTGTVDQCVQDPTFKGRVVEAGGVGT